MQTHVPALRGRRVDLIPSLDWVRYLVFSHLSYSHVCGLPGEMWISSSDGRTTLLSTEPQWFSIINYHNHNHHRSNMSLVRFQYLYSLGFQYMTLSHCLGACEHRWGGGGVNLQSAGEGVAGSSSVG